ncbi:MAG: 5-formyltetrahydrofolate cyclo-ligase [Alphaproteobacteria bacterium]|nr:5-formyltetrahydrofolate cyclo-ligase [Alphaproteobacteria bacterium]
MIDDAKSALRDRLAQVRADAERATPDAAERIAAGLIAALAPKPAFVAGYVKFRTEIDPLPAMRQLASRGARLCLPRTPARATDAPLDFRAWSEGDALERSAFGVMQPLPTAPACSPDVVLAPLLGFDRSGARLGYGQGHYDRTLASLRQARSIVAVGLAYAAQELPSAPREPHDEALDWIVTENEAIRCA